MLHLLVKSILLLDLQNPIKLLCANFRSPCNTSSARTEIGVIKRGIARIKIERNKKYKMRKTWRKCRTDMFTPRVYLPFTNFFNFDNERVESRKIYTTFYGASHCDYNLSNYTCNRVEIVALFN